MALAHRRRSTVARGRCCRQRILVSSGKDFTRLAQRLHADRLVVYGIRERKTAEAFHTDCSALIYLENVVDAGWSRKKDADATCASGGEREPVAGKLVTNMGRANEEIGDDGWVGLADGGNRIVGAAPDCNPRSKVAPSSVRWSPSRAGEPGETGECR